MATEHFSDDELRCHCGCGVVSMDETFMQRLERMRVAWGRPMVVNSGYRCIPHEANLYKMTIESHVPGFHTKGLAVDVAFSYGTPLTWKFLQLLFQNGFTGIGVRFHGPMKDRCVHMDWGTGDTRPAFWSYP